MLGFCFVDQGCSVIKVRSLFAGLVSEPGVARSLRRVRSQVQGTVVLDQGRLRAQVGGSRPSYRSRQRAAAIGRRRHRRSGRPAPRYRVQWFSGTILTGLCGAALMGGAVFASLDGETNFAAAPERVETALRGAVASIGDRLSGMRKTDRLPAISEPSVVRQILRVPTSHAHPRSRDWCACAVIRARIRQSFADGVRALRQHSAVQSAEAAGRRRRRRDDAPAAAANRTPRFRSSPAISSPLAAKARSTPGVCDLNSLLPKVRRFDVVAARRDPGARARRCEQARRQLAGACQCRPRRAMRACKLSYAA